MYTQLYPRNLLKFNELLFNYHFIYLFIYSIRVMRMSVFGIAEMWFVKYD